MKDKEKQIEEIAKMIDDRLIEARVWLGSMNRGKGYWIAQKLVEHYQPKLPEDSVVLSREEYDNLKAENDKYVKGCIDYIATINKLENKVWEVEQQAIKETAEKIYTKIKDSFLMNSNNSYALKLWIEEQFGLEIKE